MTFEVHVSGSKKAKGNKGLWAAPIVEVPGTDKVALALGVFGTSNLIRRVEAWLEKGGIDDNHIIHWPRAEARKGFRDAIPASNESRGDRYERIVRAEIALAIESNVKFETASVARSEIKKTKDFREQIDLVVVFGGICLVAEVKFFLMPADIHERVRYDDKLASAAKQAKGKAKALDGRRDVLASSLGIDLEDAKKLRLIPIIVTAQGYQFSRKIDDVIVVDAGYLRLFLSGQDIIVNMAANPLTGKAVIDTISFYGSEMAAGLNFLKSMEKPITLDRFIRQIRWGNTPLPTFAHSSAVIDVPEVVGISGFQKMKANAMADALKALL